MQTLVKTPATVLENIKGSEFPAAWRKKIKTDPAQTFTVIILEPKQVATVGTEEMPPEDQISDKLIQAVRESEEDLKAGRYAEHKTTEELFAHLDQISQSDDE